MDRRSEATWLGAGLGTFSVVWAFALVLDPRRFFAGDTVHAYYGWMWLFGDELRHGRWPILDVVGMSSGNHVAEGQMGLYNPVMAVLGVGATAVPDLVVYATVLKFGVAAVGVVGAYGLTRHYGVSAPLAAVVACSVPLCGLSLTAESSRWLDGQLVVAVLPWAWWLSRRAAAGRSPWPALVACYLVVTVGYVFGTLYLGAVLLGLLAEALVRRDRRNLVRILTLAAFSGLIAVCVYLPGVLTVAVTTRTQGLGAATGTGGPGLMRMSPWQYLLVGQPAGLAPSSNGFEGTAWRYVAWWLPLFVLVDVRAVRRQLRTLVSLLVPTVLLLLWSMAPNDLGPLRWPGRILDALTLMLALTLLVSLDRFGFAPRSRPRLAALLACVATATGLSVGLTPSRAVLQVALGAGVVVGLAAAVWLARSPRRLASLLMVGSITVGAVQVAWFSSMKTVDTHMPGELSAFRSYLPHVRGDTVVIAEESPRDLDYSAERARSRLVGSLWEMTGKPVTNGYSTIGFKPFSARFCVTAFGELCPQALARLQEREPVSGQSYLDLLSISSLVVGLRGGSSAGQPPPGWLETARDAETATWVRDRPLSTAGGVTWATPGVRVEEIDRGPLGVRLRVMHVPPGGGDVVLSRIAWPGYAVRSEAGARLDTPLAGMLLRVRLSPEDAGRTVDVAFRPPGWRWELASLVCALLVALTWTAGHGLARRRPEPALTG